MTSAVGLFHFSYHLLCLLYCYVWYCELWPRLADELFKYLSVCYFAVCEFTSNIINFVNKVLVSDICYFSYGCDWHSFMDDISWWCFGVSIGHFFNSCPQLVNITDLWFDFFGVYCVVVVCVVNIGIAIVIFVAVSFIFFF